VLGRGRQPVRVLLVDDNPVDVLVVRRMLAKAKNLAFEIESVDDAASARANLDSGAFDVCLMDRCLGAVDGIELVRDHVRTCDTTPIIMLTGMDEESSDLAAMENGAIDFVPKEELSPCALERSIRYALKNRLLQDRLRAMAELDPVTGLRSRTGFERQLRQNASKAQRDGSKFGLLYIDLDRFKPINDQLGHAAGDLVLRHIADCLERRAPPAAAVCRIGGDEFAILLTDLEDASILDDTISRALLAVEAPFEIHRETVSVSASFGASVYPDDATDLDELVQIADLAMYAAKRERRAQAA